jgi:hypothetical protein
MPQTSLADYVNDLEKAGLLLDLRRLQFKLFGNLRLGSISTQFASRLCPAIHDPRKDPSAIGTSTKRP